MAQYDRMNPSLASFLERIRAYSKIDYGTEAYPLSLAEAELILSACDASIMLEEAIDILVDLKKEITCLLGEDD